MNKVKAKIQQLIRIYKGAVPVFNSDVDIAMKAISNGTGEALYVDSTRPIDTLMTVINPTPLDSALSAEVTNFKTEMYELAGIQQVSFDMENMRSAAAVIALDQTRDTVFQAQMQGHSDKIRKMLIMRVYYESIIHPNSSDTVDWKDLHTLITDASIDLKPVHMSDPLGNKGSSPDNTPADFRQIQTARYVIQVMRGQVTFADLSMLVEKDQIKMVMAATMVKLDALGIEPPETMFNFMVAAFTEDIRYGRVELAASAQTQAGLIDGIAPAPEGAPV